MQAKVERESMVKQFEIKGEWFLSTDMDNRVHGVLRFHPIEGADLELYGSLSSYTVFPQFEDQEIILGLSSDSELITLTDCSMTSSGGAKLVQGQESGKPTVSYSVRYTLIGIHVEKKDDLLFDTISSEIFNLGEWVGISGFEYKRETKEEIEEKRVTVKYKLPDPIDFDIDKTTKGTLNFVVNRPTRYRYQKKVEINQRVEFTAKTEKDNTVEQLLEYLFGFQNFLILALYRSTYPLNVSLTGETFKNEYPDQKKYRVKVKLYFSAYTFQEDEKPKLDFDLIFRYNSIKNDFPKLIQNWFAKYELLKPAFDLLLEQFHRRNQFNTNTFLNLAQSAETFHARVNNHTRIPKDDYKRMTDEILKLTPTIYHTWLKDQFNFGNSLRLHDRLTEIVIKYSNEILEVIIPDKTEFVKQVKHSRNYYTHYSSVGKKKALHGAALFYLSEKLKLQLVCAFLMEIGFTKAQITNSLEGVKWRLFNHLADWREEEKKNK